MPRTSTRNSQLSPMNHCRKLSTGSFPYSPHDCTQSTKCGILHAYMVGLFASFPKNHKPSPQTNILGLVKQHSEVIETPIWMGGMRVTDSPTTNYDVTETFIHRISIAVTMRHKRVEARKLEHDRPPTQNQRKKEHQHKSSDIHVPTFWSLRSNQKQTLHFKGSGTPEKI